MDKALKNFATSVILLYFASSCGLFAVIFVPQNTITSTVGSNTMFMGSWLVMYAMSMCTFFIFKFKVTKRDLLILLIPLFHFVSVFWSGNPQKTLIYSLCFILNAIFVIAVSRHLNAEKLASTILKILSVMILVGMLFYFMGYENVKYLDIHDRASALGTTPIRGFFNHKITAGLYAVVALILAYTLLKKAYLLTVSSFCAFFILLTGSATAMVLGVVGLICVHGIQLAALRNVKPKQFVTFILLGLICVITIFSVVAEPVLLALNRDPTLTGRTVLWEWGLRVAFEKPIFGWGYLGYIGTNLAELEASRYIEFRNYDVPHFHSSIIQILVDGGLIYTIFLFSCIFFSLGRWYQYYLHTRQAHALAFSSILLLLIIGSFFIYYFSRYNDFTTIFTMLAISLMPKKNKVNNKC